MNNKLNTRKKLFNKFSNQLHLLKQHGLIDIELKYERTYICPLCLEQFQEDDLISSPNKNFLTEEDAPPAKLFGSRIALTCKNCNSNAGHQIDNHLINRIRENDEAKFYKGSSQYGNIEFDASNITAEITSNGNGTLSVLHKIKKNNPNLLDKFIYTIKNKNVGLLLNLKPKDYKVNSERVNIALLKTSYIITFSKFGYIFLLDEFYDNIRNQIKDMSYGYKGELFIVNQQKEENTGVYYVLNKGAKSILNVFNLKTDYSNTIVSSFIPLPNFSAEIIHSNLTNGGNKLEPGKIGVLMNVSNYDPNADLFTDIKEINKIINWKK